MKILARIIVTAFALLLVAHFLPGITVTGIFPALIAAVILGLMNASYSCHFDTPYHNYHARVIYLRYKRLPLLVCRLVY